MPFHGLLMESVLEAESKRLSQTQYRQVDDINYLAMWAGSLLEQEIFLAAPQIKLICILICFVKIRNFQSVSYFANCNVRAIGKRLIMLGSVWNSHSPHSGSCLFSGYFLRAGHVQNTAVGGGGTNKTESLSSRSVQASGEEPNERAREWMQTVADALIFINSGEGERGRGKESRDFHCSRRPEQWVSGHTQRLAEEPHQRREPWNRKGSLSGNWQKASVSESQGMTAVGVEMKTVSGSCWAL